MKRMIPAHSRGNKRGQQIDRGMSNVRACVCMDTHTQSEHIGNLKIKLCARLMGGTCMFI